MLNLENLVVRKAEDSDALSVVNLLSNNGLNSYWKDNAQWNHFYADYPEGSPLSLIAELDGKVIGHYGLLPVKFGQWPAMLGLHAYVAEPYRGLTVISMLMQEVDRYTVASGAKAICGFANSQFSLIKKTFFQWKIPFWLGFKSGLTADDLSRDNTPFFFSYSEKWIHWRFGSNKDVYFSRYVTNDGAEHIQLLKSNQNASLPQDILSFCEGWSNRYLFTKEQKNQFCQPFSVKAYDQELIDAGIYKGENWFIEMGDSDTFRYKPWDGFKLDEVILS